ncbi:MAG: hypothetical protein GY730_09270 [bacterium]|nr:hypothetical protein [bacterium]
MKKSKLILNVSGIFFIGILFSISGCTTKESAQIDVRKDNLFPEGIAFHKQKDQYFLSSVKFGQIGKVSKNGVYEEFTKDPDLISTIGLHIDQNNKLLFVCNSDPGASIKTSRNTQNKVAGLAVYSLQTGQRKHYFQLDKLFDGNHFANDVVTDKEGNAYVTDSFSPVIYKINLKTNKAEVFFTHDKFKGEGFNLNGIIYHPGGYLVVSKFNEGIFFKIPINQPDDFKQIQITTPLKGADGLVLIDNEHILVVQNTLTDEGKNQIHILASSDHWKTAQINTQKIQASLNAPTTATKSKKGSVYAINSYLDKLFSGKTNQTFQIVKVL